MESCRKDICYIYTDGSCYAGHEEKLGGTGFVMWYYDSFGDIVRELKVRKGYSFTTNSRMEMRAVIMALESLKNPLSKSVVIVMDSEFFYNAIKSGSYIEWLNNPSCWGDSKAKKKNKDLWERFNNIYSKMDKEKITFVHTKGHGKGQPEHKEGNDAVDKIVSYLTFNNFTKDGINIK